MNDKQVRFLIHCIATGMAATCRGCDPIVKRIEMEHYMNKIFDELGDKND